MPSMNGNGLRRAIGPEGCIYLRNFKCFGDAGQYVPLAPLTLLFGPNSAGKSAVFQALDVLREVVYGDRDDATPARWGFANCVHNGQTDREIVIGLLHMAAAHTDRGNIAQYPYPCFRFHVARDMDRLALKGIEVRLGTTPIADIHAVPDGLSLMRLRAEPDWLTRLLAGRETAPPDMHAVADALRTVNRNLKQHRLTIPRGGWRVGLSDEHVAGVAEPLASCLRTVVERLSYTLMEPVFLFGSNFVHIPAIRRILSRDEQLNFSFDSTRSSKDSELFVWESLLLDEAVHRFVGPSFLTRVNRWLGEDGVDLPYELSVREAGPGEGERPAPRFLVLRDRSLPPDQRIDLNLNDVGTGVSQVIPVVGACCLWNDQWIVIEQPELHLHPRAQCALADVFIAKVKQLPQELENAGNVFLLETHSEHFLLRLLRRIRETSARKLGEDHLALTPADLSVVYLRPSETGALASWMPVSTDGDFDEPWPEGFFEEREAELF